MVICRYFQQGNCRFGNACRYEHSFSNQYAYRNPSQYATISRSSVPSQNQSTNSQIDSASLIHSINTDMQIAERGKQWLLTSYGPFKDKPNFPNFEDHSFDEIRWVMYQSQKGNTIDKYFQIYNQLLQQAQSRFKFFQGPSRELLDIVKTTYLQKDDKEKTNSFGQGTLPFNQNVFSSNTQPSSGSIFGAQTPTQFGKPSTGNIFASNVLQTTNKSIFGGNQTNFSSVQNRITNSPLTGQSTNIFASTKVNSPLATTNNVFATNTSNVTNNIFASASNQNIFNVHSESESSKTGGVFIPERMDSFQQDLSNTNSFPASGFQQASTVFNSIPAGGNQTSVFANSQPTNIFAQGNNSSVSGSIFGQPGSQSQLVTQQINPIESAQNIFKTANTNAVQSSNIIFGNNSQSDSNRKEETVIHQQYQQQSNVYSELEDLTEEDLNSFKSPSFELGKIPEEPPPLSLCFIDCYK